MEEKSIARKVRDLLKEKPFIEESIVLGVANLSKVAESLKDEIKGASFHAVHAALRRHADVLVKDKNKLQKKVIDLLKKSTITINSGLISVKLKLNDDSRKLILNLMNKGADISILKGADTITVITGREHEHLFKKEENIKELNTSLGAVILKSPKEVVFTKGFIAFITNLISKENINIIDFMWSYETTIIVVNKMDAGKVYDVLTQFIE